MSSETIGYTKSNQIEFATKSNGIIFFSGKSPITTSHQHLTYL